MSSPYPPKTNRGTEETLVSIDRTIQWASRISASDISGVDVDSFIDKLQEEEEQLRDRYKIKTTELAVDNFVFNKTEKVEEILCGNLDEKVEALSELKGYIAEDFGYEYPLSLSREELTWLVAQELKRHLNSSTSDYYEREPFESMNLDGEGQRPEEWTEAYPMYKK